MRGGGGYLERVCLAVGPLAAAEHLRDRIEPGGERIGGGDSERGVGSEEGGGERGCVGSERSR